MMLHIHIQWILSTYIKSSQVQDRISVAMSVWLWNKYVLYTKPITTNPIMFQKYFFRRLRESVFSSFAFVQVIFCDKRPLIAGKGKWK